MTIITKSIKLNQHTPHIQTWQNNKRAPASRMYIVISKWTSKALGWQKLEIIYIYMVMVVFQNDQTEYYICTCTSAQYLVLKLSNIFLNQQNRIVTNSITVEASLWHFFYAYLNNRELQISATDKWLKCYHFDSKWTIAMWQSW